MAFGTKPHYQTRQIAPRHFFQTADQVGIGPQVIESVIQELLDGTASAVESVVDSLPANFPDEIESSIEAGIKGRLGLFGEP
jgi:serine/threonine-protein kinase HipA